ncbi:hypothetical protein AGABI1DRAFT_112550, partial [Agaricus bisporus var. burnettii JB137-S8]
TSDKPKGYQSLSQFQFFRSEPCECGKDYGGQSDQPGSDEFFGRTCVWRVVF